MPRVSEEHLQARREEIIDAARAVFVEGGFAGTSMAEPIAAERPADLGEHRLGVVEVGRARATGEGISAIGGCAFPEVGPDRGMRTTLTAATS